MLQRARGTRALGCPTQREGASAGCVGSVGVVAALRGSPGGQGSAASDAQRCTSRRPGAAPAGRPLPSPAGLGIEFPCCSGKPPQAFLARIIACRIISLVAPPFTAGVNKTHLAVNSFLLTMLPLLSSGTVISVFHEPQVCVSCLPAGLSRLGEGSRAWSVTGSRKALWGFLTCRGLRAHTRTPRFRSGLGGTGLLGPPELFWWVLGTWARGCAWAFEIRSCRGCSCVSRARLTRTVSYTDVRGFFLDASGLRKRNSFHHPHVKNCKPFPISVKVRWLTHGLQMGCRGVGQRSGGLGAASALCLALGFPVAAGVIG